MRKSSLRKAVLALLVLAMFMVILRLSRPTPTVVTEKLVVNDPIAVAPEPVADQAPIDHSNEDAHVLKDIPKDAFKDTNRRPALNQNQRKKDPKEKEAELEKEVADIKDVKESQEVIDAKVKDVEEAKNPKDPEETKETKDSKDSKAKDPKAKDPKAKDPKAKDSKDKDSKAKDSKDSKDSKEGKTESNFDAEAAYKLIVEGKDSPPVVIFSKSYCPHSLKAKNLLLEGHTIVPTPAVVELDKMDHGAEFQKYLGELTGRRTVPNVLVNGISRGGASDLVEMGDTLVANFLKWGDGRLSMAVQQPAMADN